MPLLLAAFLAGFDERRAMLKRAVEGGLKLRPPGFIERVRRALRKNSA